MRQAGTRSGFTLIEALVALTITAMTMTAIFQLQTQMARGQRRAEAVLRQVAMQENALALVRDINVMERPIGEFVLPDGDVIRWRAVPKEAVKRNTALGGAYGRFEVQLFEVTVEIERPGGPNPPDMIIERVGWRRTDASGVQLF